jgi:hypothetical protein
VEWTREVRMETDEERERKAKKVKKPGADVVRETKQSLKRNEGAR